MVEILRFNEGIRYLHFDVQMANKKRLQGRTFFYRNFLLTVLYVVRLFARKKWNMALPRFCQRVFSVER